MFGLPVHLNGLLSNPASTGGLPESEDGSAGIHALLGEKNAAFEWVDKARQGRAGGMVYLRADWAFKSLQGDPRFDALLHQMGVRTPAA